nr:ABC transporter ATP-binding protein [Rhizobium leguminosarum]
MTAFIKFDLISKSYGTLRVMEDLNLAVARGEFVSLLGPSGSGKTTLLMMLAGFEQPTSGVIFLDGKAINEVPTHKRDMGVVFQNYALFPHMSVGENVAFPLQMRGVNKADVAKRVMRALEMVQLAPLANRRPSQLSGGQQQRVALARALVFEPRVVLMDEPLGALDKNLREQMQLDIRDLHRRLGLTIVFVTHDQSEALTMSDRIAVFNKGKIEQIGTPRQVYDAPTSRFVAEFIGETNLVDAVVESVIAGQALVRLHSGEKITSAVTGTVSSGQEVYLSIRPERLELTADKVASENHLELQVTDSVYQGNHMRVQLSGAGNSMIASINRRSEEFGQGTKVYAGFSSGDCKVIAK